MRNWIFGGLAVFAAFLMASDRPAQAASMTAFGAETITVTTTGTNIYALTSTAGGALAVNQCVKIKVPVGGATVYVGPSTVTAAATAGSHGYPILAGESESIPAGADKVYLRVAASTQVVHVIYGNGC